MRCVIVDDEPPARLRLRRLLAAFADLEVVGEAHDGPSALEQVASLKPDVVLLDIELPELDGLGVAAALEGRGPAIVFVTAYDQHALRAFELAAVDYLVKPIAPERLAAALDKVRARAAPQATELTELLARLHRPERRMAVRCGAKYLVFDPARISAILARDHYSALILDGKELLADDPLDTLIRRFDAATFFRVHRSAAINVRFLRELVHEGDRRYVAVLSDAAATRVPVARERLAALKAGLGLD